ncbi:stalk domain-containing protein [Paenibacillus sp.]|uniref:stalk domain-containing protein n=1 Tax=Paenibacillus sp. TaxID=58172 RepID=UPI002810AE7D|nr:stalk domain-containing protein [Paenibacillus sp.]
MKNLLKRGSALAAASAIIFGSAFAVAQANNASETQLSISIAKAPISFTFNGQVLAPAKGEEGFIHEGTTYVPLRFMSNAVEKSVAWDGNTMTVYVTEPSKNEKEAIRKSNAAYAVESSTAPTQESVVTQSIGVFSKPITYMFDGVKKTPAADKSGFIYNNKVYVPLRFFSDSVGQNVQFDPKTYAIKVTGKTQESKSPTTPKQPQTNDQKPGTTAPTQPATPPTVGGGGGAGGGAGVPKPSAESIESDAISKILALQFACEAKLTDIKNKYEAATDPSEKDALYSQGEAEFIACDNAFYSLIADFKNRLQDNGYDVAVADGYVNLYEDFVADKKAQYGL